MKKKLALGLFVILLVGIYYLNGIFIENDNEHRAGTTTKISDFSGSDSSSNTTELVTTSSNSTIDSEMISEPNQTTEQIHITESSSVVAKSQFYDPIFETDTSYGMLLLVNKNWKLPDDYTAPDIVEVPEGYFYRDNTKFYLNSTVLEAFKQMSRDAKKDGVNILILSGYRPKSTQAYLYNLYVEKNGRDEADTYSARPRHSEHETGLSLDIYPISSEDRPEFDWMMNNAYKYGFILRYPKGKEHITGYIYEPWHWRYVGELAKTIKDSELTYDEYFFKYIKK